MADLNPSTTDAKVQRVSPSAPPSWSEECDRLLKTLGDDAAALEQAEHAGGRGGRDRRRGARPERRGAGAPLRGGVAGRTELALRPGGIAPLLPARTPSKKRRTA